MQIKISKLKRIILSVLLLVSVSTELKAADISALDFDGNLIGKVIPDGSVIDFDNELIGHITADGFAVNEDNILIGGIVPQGVAISITNSVLGKVNNDGTVTSLNDVLVGRVLPNGLVVNDNDDVLGAVIAPGVVYDDKGKIVGRVSGDGNFYSLSGEKKGYVTATGYVFAPQGTDQKTTLVGKLISSKMVIDNLGNFLGSIAPDGKVVDLKKTVIGNIHANGFVYNADNNVIGHIVESGYAFNLDGSYLGSISYNGEVVDKGRVVGSAVVGNRIISKDGELQGFAVSSNATANTLDGKYLGRLVSNGNVIKSQQIIGKIGASGNVVNNNGVVIGTINSVGPIFDYLGNLRANAAVDGKIISLDGAELGYTQKNKAIDRKGKEFGRVLNNLLNYTSFNTFIGVNGISTSLNADGNEYTISPYGYVFDEKGAVVGRNYAFANIIADKGKILAYTSGLGKTESASLNEIAKLTSAGLLLDKNNKLLGNALIADYATDFYGNLLGYTNPSNLIINNQNQTIAKILPDNQIILSNQMRGYAGNSALSISINGDYLGANYPDGQIKTAGEIVGKISSDKYVLDNAGALYGKTLEFGVAVKPDCKFLGVVSDNGDVKNFNGKYIGTVLANNQVVNETEEVIGYIIHPQAVIGDNGEILGVETPLGTVLNYDNRNLGCQDINGYIRNSQNEIVGQIIPSASVMGYDNTIIGEVDFSGKVIDGIGNQAGYIRADEGVYSNNGANIGSIFKYNVAFDDNNTYLGRVDASGTVLSDVGEVLGKVNFDGSVTLENGNSGFALYDLYVYDNNSKTVGYIAKNGTVYSVMGDVKGSIYKGFVLDKKQNLIARGKRDYIIRNKENKIIGYLNLDGSVVNHKNIKVGELNDKGEVVDTSGEIIANAYTLQYYHRETKQETLPEKNNIVSEQQTVLTPTSPSEKENIKDNTIIETNINNQIEEPIISSQTEEPEYNIDRERVNNTMAKHKIVGIAVTPGGKYIGDVYSNNDVIDSHGNIIGSRGKNGEIVDANGNVIGNYQEKDTEKNKSVDKDWWRSIMNGVTASPYNTNNEAVNVGPGGGIGPGGRYNPRRAAIIAQLQNNRRQSMSGKSISSQFDATSYTGWQDNWPGVERSISSLRVDMSNMITADKPIPAVLARSLISLGSAPITAIVERNIYGDMGRNVIIPAGSRIIGGLSNISNGSRFDGTSGGVKLDITWDRIIRPDGIAFILDSSSQTGDAQGRGGGALGYVDEQMLKKYTMPLVGTVATSAMAYLMAANEDATGEVETSKQQAASDARQQFIDKMNSILDEIIESKSNIEAVTYVPAGTRIIIYPMTDLWLKSTKEIEKGEDTLNNTKAENILINRSGNETKVETNNNSNTNNAQNKQGQQGATLVSNNGNGQQKQQKNTAPGAIPPPAADGTVADYPKDDDEMSGDIELF